MRQSSSYYMLIGSLPALPVHFEDAERVPISRRGLEERLKMLDPDAAEVLEQMAEFLLWDRQPLDRTDVEFCSHYDRIMAGIEHRFARELIEQIMTRRTILSALRRRRLGLGPPPGVGWAAEHIARHWSHPHFRLATQFPWIAEVETQLNGDRPFELEQKLLNIAWSHVKRLADQYHFCFEALVLYLIRWEIVYRWTSRDATAGRGKFEQLVQDAMGEYGKMFDMVSPRPEGEGIWTNGDNP
jgi:hypothetical protein